MSSVHDRLARVAIGVVAVLLTLTLGACAPQIAESPDHEALTEAVRDSSSEISDVIVEDGTDGTSRYLFIELDMAGDELSATAAGAAMEVVAESLPDEYDSVEVVARTAGGDRIALESPLREAGLDPLMMGRLRASILADALRGYTAPQ